MENAKISARITKASVLILIIIIAVFVLFFLSHRASLSDAEMWRQLSFEYPVLAPVFIVLMIMVEVVIAPLPGGFIPILTGFLFGVFQGTLYSWIGNILGAVLAWWLAHYFGRSLIKHLVKEETISFYDTWLYKRQWLIWVLYLVPLFPIDVISFSIGISKIKFKTFFIMISLALLPNMWLLNILGDRIYETRIVYIFWLAAAIIFFIIIYSFIREWRTWRQKEKHIN